MAVMKYYIYSVEDDFPLYDSSQNPWAFFTEAQATEFLNLITETPSEYYIKRVCVKD